jgi:site-specific recombinase XerD
MNSPKTKDPLTFSFAHEFITVHLPQRLGRSPATVSAYINALTLFRRYALEARALALDGFHFSTITVEFMLDFRLWLLQSQEEKPQSANQRFCLVRNYLKYCGRQDVSLASLHLDLMDVPSLRYDKPCEEALPEEAVALILRMPDNSRKGIRNRLFMILLYETAARVAEILSLKVCNVFLDCEHPHIVLLGKGNKRRAIPITRNTCDHIRHYSALFHPEGSSIPYLFHHTIKGETGMLSHDCVEAFLDKYAAMAHECDPEVPKHIHSHLFRRSKASHLSDNGIGLPVVSRFLGHADISTTMVYVRPNQQKMREAVERNSVGHELLDSEAEEYEHMRAHLCGIR